MGIRAKHLRQEYAGLDDAEIARAYALKSGYHVVVTYEDSGGLAFKGLRYDRELEEVRKSPYISNVKVLYHDGHLEDFDEADRRAAERARRVLGSNDRAVAPTAADKGNSDPDLRIEHNDRQCCVCGHEVESATWNFFEFTCFQCGATSIVHKTCVAPGTTPFDHFSGDMAFPMGCPRCNPEKSAIHFAKIRSSRVTASERPASAQKPPASQGIFRRLYRSLVVRASSTGARSGEESVMPPGDPKTGATRYRVTEGAGPDFTRHNLEAARHYRSGNYRAAATSWTDAIKCCGPDAAARSGLYSNRGQTYIAMDEYESAKSDFEEAIKLDSNNIAAHNGLGSIALNTDAFVSAIKAFSRALEIDPTSEVALYNRGQAFFLSGAQDKARRDQESLDKLKSRWAKPLDDMIKRR